MYYVIIKTIWYEDAGVLLKAKSYSLTGVQLPDLHGNNPQSYTKAFIFSSVRNTDVFYLSYVITKAHYKFGNLQVYNYINDTIENVDGLWENIPKYSENNMQKELFKCKIPITRSVDKYVNALFKIL